MVAKELECFNAELKVEHFLKVSNVSAELGKGVEDWGPGLGPPLDSTYKGPPTHQVGGFRRFRDLSLWTVISVSPVEANVVIHLGRKNQKYQL
jgi:hypothetical protein